MIGSISVDLIYTIGTVTVVEPITTFTTYTTSAVANTVTAPCSGAGEMVFTPVDGGSGATSSSVPVTFANISATG